MEGAGFAVRTFLAGNGVIPESEKTPPSLFLLDIMVPGHDGLDICRQIRNNRNIAMTPVIFLTAKTSEADKIAGLDLGADDYIAKPFSPRELIARVKAVLRRFEPPLTMRKISHGELQIDSGAMSVEVSGQPVTTTATEFRL